MWNPCFVQILGKAELLNPGGSVKDRIALRIVEEALEDGRLAPGRWLVRASQLGRADRVQLGWGIACNRLGRGSGGPGCQHFSHVL